MKKERVEISKSLLGNDTVDMLLQVHQDALWTLENFGVGCKQKELQNIFRQFEAKGQAVVYEDRIYLMGGLVEKCFKTVPGVSEFFVPLNSFFIGGTAPYVYDENKGKGGVFPTPEHAARIAQIAEENRMVAGMGRG